MEITKIVEATDEAAARQRAFQLAEQDGYRRIELVKVDRDLGRLWRVSLNVGPDVLLS
ncbi:MAG TPA: hypothetical protein VNE21_06645 [Mycobacteriales bacterium]|nr:hypothetical protein [Mycobacteriales bacterium]